MEPTGRFTIFDLSWQSLLGASFDDSLLGTLPVLLTTDILVSVHLVTQGDLSLKALEVKRLEDDEDDIHHLAELFLDLVRTAEEVGIILRKATHTRQSMELATLLIAIDRTELSQALR